MTAAVRSTESQSWTHWQCSGIASSNRGCGLEYERGVYRCKSCGHGICKSCERIKKAGETVKERKPNAARERAKVWAADTRERLRLAKEGNGAGEVRSKKELRKEKKLSRKIVTAQD